MSSALTKTEKHSDTDRTVESHDLSGGSFKFRNFVSNTFAMPSSESNWNVFSPGSLTLQLASCQFHNHGSCMLAMPWTAMSLALEVEHLWCIRSRLSASSWFSTDFPCDRRDRYLQARHAPHTCCSWACIRVQSQWLGLVFLRQRHGIDQAQDRGGSDCASHVQIAVLHTNQEMIASWTRSAFIGRLWPQW